MATLVIGLDSRRPRSLEFRGFVIVESECLTCPVIESRVAAEEEEEDGFVRDTGMHASTAPYSTAPSPTTRSAGYTDKLITRGCSLRWNWRISDDLNIILYGVNLFENGDE